MAVTFPTKYPTALTDAAWQRKKSLKDKANSKTKTGLGAALKAAEAKWKRIPWDALRADKQAGDAKTRAFTVARKNREAAQKVLDNQVRQTIEALEAAASKARVTAKNAALSKGAVTAATKLSGDLTKQAKLLNDIKLNDFDTEIRKGQQVWDKEEDAYQKRIRAIDACLDDLDRNFSLADWERNAKALEKLIFLSYHFTITSIDTLGFREYDKSRERWKALDDLFGRTEAAIKRLKPGDDGAVAIQVGHFVENARPLMGPM